MKDINCDLCKKTVESEEHLFNHECPKLKSKQIQLLDNIENMFKEVVLISNGRKNEFFHHKGILYTPLQNRIPIWKMIKFKTVPIELLPKIIPITDNYQNKVKLKSHNNWYTNIIKYPKPQYKFFNIGIHSGMIGLIPKGATIIFKNGVLKKKLLIY